MACTLCRRPWSASLGSDAIEQKFTKQNLRFEKAIEVARAKQAADEELRVAKEIKDKKDAIEQAKLEEAERTTKYG